MLRLLLLLAMALPLVRGFPSARAQTDELRLPCTSVNDELNFTNYWLGPSFEGQELTQVLRNCGHDYNSIDFIYGDCTAHEGSCTYPLDIQVWPANLRNREMYQGNPPLFEIQSEDRVVNGIPATSYGGHFEVYYPDTTVVIFGDAAPKGYVAKFLVEGPSRLADLEQYGLYFDEDCQRNIRGCSADRSSLGQDTEFLIGVVTWCGLLFGTPFLLALFVGRRWVLLVPVAEILLLYVAGSLRWIPTGESWTYFLIPGLLILEAVVGFGLVLRWLFLEAMRRRREARASGSPP